MKDDAAQSVIAAEIATRLTGSSSTRVETGPIQRNYFSILFTADAPGNRRYMVKVPKTDLRARPAGRPSRSHAHLFPPRGK